MSKPAKLSEDLRGALQSAYPELAAVRERAGDLAVYVVGGAVRDLLLGRGRADLDLVVEGDAAALAARMGAEVVEHERFATAKLRLSGHEIDIATARTETYEFPGALPEVQAASLAEDLGRRDFTINAMALPLTDGGGLVDPHGGHDDLAAGLLRVLRPGSFRDDPTRALRGARYAARYGFDLEQETAALLANADLGTVSADRRRAELLRLAAEDEAVRALELASEWGLVEPRGGGVELAATAEALLGEKPWRGIAEREPVLLGAVLGPPGAEIELMRARPKLPSEAVALAATGTAVELVLARAMGAAWLDNYVTEWRLVRLEIDGDDLIAAGVPQGPALGRGLDHALRLKLDGEVSGHEQELAAALKAAGGSDGVA